MKNAFVWLMIAVGFPLILLFVISSASFGILTSSDLTTGAKITMSLVEPDHDAGWSWFKEGFKKATRKPLSMKQIEERRRTLGY